MRVLRTASAAALLLGAACATTSALDRSFGEGRYADVVRIFESDSTLWSREGAVYQVIVARAVPGTAVYDPLRAERYMTRYLARFPNASHAPHVRRLSLLVDEVVRLDSAAARSEDRTRRFAREADSLRVRLDSLRALVAFQRERFDSLRAAERAEDRERDAAIQELREELNRLKAIDLRSSRAPAATPPDTTVPDTMRPGVTP